MRKLARVQPQLVSAKTKRTRGSGAARQSRRSQDDSLDAVNAVPVAVRPPRDARWRIERNIPGVGWCFDSYAKSEDERKQKIASIRAFRGVARAVKLPLQPATAGDADESFIGDEAPAFLPGIKTGRKTTRTGGRGEVAVRPPSHGGTRVPVADGEIPRSDAEMRLLQAQAAHWLRYAEDAGCRVSLSAAVWEKVLEASKKSLRTRPRAFEQALNRQPKPV
jgi:hypothetical protein